MLFNPIQNKIIGIFPILEHNYFRRPEIFKEEGDAFLIETYYYRKRYKLSDLSKAEEFYFLRTLYNFKIIYGTNKVICKTGNGIYLLEEKNGDYIPIKRISDDVTIGEKRISLSKQLFCLDFDSSYIFIILMNETWIEITNNPHILIKHNRKNIGRLIKNNLPVYNNFIKDGEDISKFDILSFDDKMNLYCIVNNDNLYIFNRNKILNTIPIDIEVRNVNLYGKRFVLINGDNKGLYIYDKLYDNWTSYINKNIHKDIFSHNGKLYYIQTTFNSISLIDIEDGTVLKAFNAEKYKSIAQVIVTPQNYLASFSKGSNYISIWDIELDEPIYSVSLHEDRKLSIKGFEGLYIVNNCLVIELKTSLETLPIHCLLPLDENINLGLYDPMEGYYYIKDFAKKEFYVYHADPMYPSHKEKRNVEILSFSSN